MRVFRRQAQAASLDSSAARGQRVHGASPKSRIGLSRGDVGQLSVERWGRYKPGRQAYEYAIGFTLHPKFSRHRLAARLDEVGGPNNVLAKD
jgi:hypothetical protein